MTDGLELSQVSFAYGGVVVLDRVDLHVRRGEIVGVVGPNGAGKTTLLRVASGAARPLGGSVMLDGIDMLRLGPGARARAVAHVPQSPVVPEGFTVLDVVLMGRNPHLRFMQWEGRRDLEIALDAMEATDTAEFADRPLGSLSGGERQRVFVARALAQAPVLLVLDEPTTHLDLGYQVDIMDTIDRLRREREIAVLIAMHDLTLAAQYCDRITVLHAGRIRAAGTPSQVMSPELLSQVFGTRLAMTTHPVLGTPIALPVGRPREGSGTHT
jgi:iron complex transport system ATP-binding protein